MTFIRLADGRILNVRLIESIEHGVNQGAESSLKITMASGKFHTIYGDQAVQDFWQGWSKLQGELG